MVRPGIWSLGLATLLMVGIVSAGDKTDSNKPTCAAHGTSIDFLDTPSEAAKQARKEKKLVFVLHVSGDFEDPRFT
jgi:hypothetical protein